MSPGVPYSVHCTGLPRAWVAFHNILSPVKHDSFKPELQFLLFVPQEAISVFGTGLVNHEAIGEDIERFIEQLASKALESPIAGL